MNVRLRRQSMTPLFAIGFRPFFLAAGVWAVVAMAGWLALLAGAVDLPLAVAPLSWHVHEMLFGYAAASVTGFVLTAVPNWTGRLPVGGWPLAGLFVLWLVGRLAMLTGAWLGASTAAVIDGAFLALLVLMVGQEIIVGRNWRNLPVLFALTLLAAANGLYHAAQLWPLFSDALAIRLAIAVLTLLIALIGGRITPSFTRNWLVKRGTTQLPAPFDGLDRSALGATLLALIMWVVMPDTWPGAVLLLGAAALLAIRLARWQGHRTFTEPLVTVLHLGYLWLPVGLAMLAAPLIWPNLSPAVALHALTVGAVGTMTLAVMTRATLGHSGRALTATPATTTIYVLITLAALSRLAAGVSDILPLTLLQLSGLAWIAAFAGFVIVYAPVILRPRGPGQ